MAAGLLGAAKSCKMASNDIVPMTIDRSDLMTAETCAPEDAAAIYFAYQATTPHKVPKLGG